MTSRISPLILLVSRNRDKPKPDPMGLGKSDLGGPLVFNL